MRALFLFIFVIAGPTSAQGFVVHVPDADPSTGVCNAIPFGTSSGSARWSNQRYQTIVQVGDLSGVPGTVTGLRFAPCNSGWHTSSTIRITLAHVPAGFSLAVNTDFEANLHQLGRDATVVLHQERYAWPMTADTWSSVGCDLDFAYDGVDDLLVDVLVTGNAAVGAGTSSMRHSSRERLYALGWSASPPPTGLVDRKALKIGVEFGCAGIGTYGSGCAGMTLGLSGSAELGARVEILLGGVDSGLPCMIFFGAQNAAPFPIDLTSSGFAGCRLYTAPGLTVPGLADPTGRFSVAFGVPSDRSLRGVVFHTQGAGVVPNAPGGVATSNAGRIRFGAGCGSGTL